MYTDCFYNMTREERIDIFRRKQGFRLQNMYQNMFGWLMLPFAVVATVLTVTFIYVLYEAIRDRRISRKCYILILNRSFGDLVSCIFALIVCFYCLLMPEVNRDLIPLMESVFIGSFWSAMTSYVSLSILKLFAVWRPFHYRKWFTMKRCVYLIILSWFVFVLMIAYAVGVNAIVKIPALEEWSGCKVETCLRIMYRSRNYVTCAVYFFTLFVFVGTVFFLSRARKSIDSMKKREKENTKGGRIQSKLRFPLWKLALNVATFAGLYIFYIIFGLGMFFADACFWQRNFVEMMSTLAVVRCTLMVRIIADPIVSFVTDFQLRRGFLEIFGVHRPLVPGSRVHDRKTTTTTLGTSSVKSTASTAIDENRSSSVRTEPSIAVDLGSKTKKSSC